MQKKSIYQNPMAKWGSLDSELHLLYQLHLSLAQGRCRLQLLPPVSAFLLQLRRVWACTLCYYLYICYKYTKL